MAPKVTEYLRTKNTIKLTWISLTPDIALGIVTKYTIMYKTGTKIAKRQDTAISGNALSVNGSSNQAVIDKLDPDFSYQVQIFASTSVGEGKVSDPIIVEGEEVYVIIYIICIR